MFLVPPTFNISVRKIQWWLHWYFRHLSFNFQNVQNWNTERVPIITTIENACYSVLQAIGHTKADADIFQKLQYFALFCLLYEFGYETGKIKYVVIDKSGRGQEITARET